jgi:ferredoxin
VRVLVNPDRCQGHALCAVAAPELFDLSDDDDGHSVVKLELVPSELADQALRAELGCPEGAITVIDDAIPTTEGATT